MKKEVLIAFLTILTIFVAGCVQQIQKSPPVGEGESEGEGPGRYFREVEICNTDSDCEDFYIKSLNRYETVYFNNYQNAIRLVDIEGSTKIKLLVGEVYGQDVLWYGETWASLNEIALSGSIIIQPIQITPQSIPASAIVKISTEDSITLHGELMNPGDQITVDGNTIELERINVERYGDYIGKEENDLRTLYGTIIKNPSSNSASDQVILEIPQQQVKANVKLSSRPTLFIPYEPGGDGINAAVVALKNKITGMVTLTELTRIIPLGTPLQSDQGFQEVITANELGGLQDTSITFNGNNYDVHDEIVFLNNYTNVETDLTYYLMDYTYDVFIGMGGGGVYDYISYYYRFDTPVDLTEANGNNPINITFLNRELNIIGITFDSLIVLSQDGTNESYNDYQSYGEELVYAVGLEIEGVGFFGAMEEGDSIDLYYYGINKTITLVEIIPEDHPEEDGEVYVCVEDHSEGSIECQYIEEWGEGEVNGIYIFVNGIYPYTEGNWRWDLANLYGDNPVIGITNDNWGRLPTGQCDNFPEDAFSLCFDSITPTTYNTYSIKYNSCRDLNINGCFQTFDLTSDIENGYTLLANGIDGLNSDRIVDEIYLKYNNYNVEVYYSLGDVINVIYAGTANQNAFAKKTNSNIEFTISSISQSQSYATLSITTIAESVDESIDLRLGIWNNNFNGLGFRQGSEESSELEWSHYISPDYVSALFNINGIGYPFIEEQINLIQDLLIKVHEINEEAEIVTFGIESVNQYGCDPNGVFTKFMEYSCLNYNCFTDLSFDLSDPCEAPEYCIDGVACCTKSPEEFFPITSWHTGNETSSLQTLRNMGFNSFTDDDLRDRSTGGPLSDLNILKESDNYNLKYFAWETEARDYSNYGLANQETMETNILNDVNAYCSYPSLSRYYLNDEPYPNEVDEMATVTSILNSFDPEHPGIAAYSNSYDYLAYNVHPNELYIDPYPIFSTVSEEDTKSAFTWHNTLLAFARETALQEGIPLWYIAQVFGTRDPGTLDQTWRRIPTPEELREMVYMALAYGAKGVGYYRYTTGIISGESRLYEGLVEEDYVTPREPLYSTVDTLNNELGQLAPTLLNLNSLGTCNSRTLEEINEPLSACKDCSYEQWYIEKPDIEITEYMGESVTFYFEKPDQDTDYWGLFYQFSRIDSSDFPYIKIDYEILENNRTSLNFQPIRGEERQWGQPYSEGLLYSIPMPSSVGRHTFYTYLDDLKGRGVCQTYRNCIDCVSPTCEKNASISILFGDVVDLTLEEGESVEIDSFVITVTSILWDRISLIVDNENGPCDNGTLFRGETENICDLNIRLNEINRITSRSDSECTERCENDKTQLRFYFYSREQGNSMKLKINDITEAYCELPFITEATGDVELGNFKDNNNKKYIIAVNRDPLNQMTTTITFSSGIGETGLTDMLTNERFAITQNRANIPLAPGHGRLLRLDQPV